MRSSTLAALTAATTLALAACGAARPLAAPTGPAPAPEPVAVAPAPEPPEPAPPAKPPLSQQIPVALKAMVDAFVARDAQKMADLFTEDATVASYGLGETHGRGELAAATQGSLAAFGDLRCSVTRVWIKGSVAIAEMVWSATMTGDMMGIKASKKPVGEVRLNVMWFTDDGLIKEMHEYGNGSGLFAQMQGKRGAPPVPVVPTGLPELHFARATPEEDGLVAWVKTGDAALDKDDPKVVAAGMAEDGDYWLNLTGQPATRGPKANLAGLTAWYRSFPDQKWSITSVWGIDGFALVEHTMSATNRAGYGPLPSTGKKVAGWHFADILQPSADGKLHHAWGFANPVEMLVQTGALKPPTPPRPAPPPAARP